MKGLSIGLLVVGFVLFFGCKSEPKSITSEKDDIGDPSILIENGKEIASATFLSLSTELQKAMKTGGVDHALSYCNLNASGITDSLSTQYNADIKRTSLKFRNPGNAPSKAEEKFFINWKIKRKLENLCCLK